ncbi:MAG: NYN domain-containing protein [Gloeomargarita sp. SKYBB_i_bin120]|nr:NYN domain-containing protein [Gloeomargarita sp. SKYG98]MCS7292935.1 NYN domain-containing protein [Gloeomargarita sp. SKYB120]MDW8178500.1 NYN domain-containing protein [Gloeomargarita sp. SKYBB_i_bin120]
MSPKAATLMVVDGYNVIGAKWDLRQGDLDPHRQALIEHLCNYSAMQGYETYIIFDAHRCPQPERWEPITDRVQVCYTGYGTTADAYIERFCAQHRGRDQRLIVVTSDRLAWMTAGGYGAEWMSSQSLWQAIAQLDSQHRSTASPRPSRGLPQAVQARLRQWLENDTL